MDWMFKPGEDRPGFPLDLAQFGALRTMVETRIEARGNASLVPTETRLNPCVGRRSGGSKGSQTSI